MPTALGASRPSHAFSPLLRFASLTSLALLAGALGTAALTQGCATEPGETGDQGEIGESEDAIVPITEVDETAPAAALGAAPLDARATELLDVRGVGDAAWSNTHEPTALPAGFGAALDRFDASGLAYRGDLSFINWESVVGTRCTRFASEYVPARSYAFVSRPENLVEAADRGFNLIGLSNNHTRDCYGSPETSLGGEGASSDMTARNIRGLGERAWLWSGVTAEGDGDDLTRARLCTFPIKGRDVRVAFASLYTGRASCPRAACKGDKAKVLESLRDAAADVRILAIHSMAKADQDEAVHIGIDFVKRYGGDVVFGHGPHVWKPLRVVRKEAAFGGGTGVVFESVGNFIHPSLGAQSKNLIGRALFDLGSMKLRQVQLLPIRNTGTDVRWSADIDGAALPSNLRFSQAPAVHGVFANVKP